MATLRIRELGRLMRARHGDKLPDDAGGRAFLTIMVHHLASLAGTDPRARIDFWISEHADWLPMGEARGLIASAIARPQRWTAAALAWRLQLNQADRATLRITTIGATDENPQERAKRKQSQKQERERQRRRAKGAKSRAEYLASVRGATPWKALGISRATYYRQRQ
jgi:hypothetical protein